MRLLVVPWLEPTYLDAEGGLYVLFLGTSASWTRVGTAVADPRTGWVTITDVPEQPSGYWAWAESTGWAFVAPSAPARDASEDLQCPNSGCQRPKPAENATGGLTCWWCGHTGSWHEFPKRRVYEDGGK